MTAGSAPHAADWQTVEGLISAHFLECHTEQDAAKGLDFKTLGRDLARPENLAQWVRSYGRVEIALY